MSEQSTIKISVRNLVEFILRAGDLDNRNIKGMDLEAMQLGSKMHRRIQRNMSSNYHAEVPLKLIVPCDGFDILVEGRADGIILEESQVIIDEIKGIFADITYMKEPIKAHQVQAKCYAYIYGSQKQLEQIVIQMTYCQLKTEEIKRFQETYKLKELEEWFLEVVKQYEKWARFQIDWRAIRDDSIKGVEFPFTYRKGQKNLVSSVYKTILRKKKLFIQAPTGVGKTMAAIFPAVKAMGEGLGDKIFYLTAKTITRTVAEQAFETLKLQNLKFKVITLTAKDKICFCEQAECYPAACSYAKGHYDRVNDAVFDLITTADDMKRERIEEYARKHHVCPFEMSLDASTWIDGIICDYNYVFDPNANLKRFFAEGVPGNYLFLIDEAHNLVERGREMYSATIYKEDILHTRKIVKALDVKLAKRLSECNQLLLEWKRQEEIQQVLESVSVLAIKLMNVMVEMERFMEECQDADIKEQILDLYFAVRTFLNIHDTLDDNYVIYSELEEKGRFKLKLFCVNPAVNLQRYLDKGNSTILFSATFLPINYYKQLLSTNPDDYAIYAETPFDSNNRLLLLGNDVSTKYTSRGPKMYERYADYIYQATSVKAGNYLAFFPSYQFMEQVYSYFESRVLADQGMVCLLQEQYMDEGKREEFIRAFEVKRTGSLIGFCVMGGIFSEGIDLTEYKLIGAMIVGTGIPQVCYERENLKHHFDVGGFYGYDYAYLYPGMNKVLQAAGRVIRTERDKGVILLLDERFLQRQYQTVFPREWEGAKVCNVMSVKEMVKEFWMF